MDYEQHLDDEILSQMFDIDNQGGTPDLPSCGGYIHVYESEIYYYIKRCDLFDKIEGFHTHFISGHVISNALRLVYYCGLSKDEVFGLKIKDVKGSGGEIFDQIEIQGARIPITNVKDIIQSNFNHLRERRYSHAQNAPLFPKKNGSPYNDEIYKHLYKVEFKLEDEFRGYGIGIENIKRAGICNYYEELKSEEKHPDLCLLETAIYARKSVDTVRNIIEGHLDEPKDTTMQCLQGCISRRINETLCRGKALDENQLMNSRAEFFRMVDNEEIITRHQKKIMKRLFDVKFAEHKVFFKGNNVSYKEEAVVFVEPENHSYPELDLIPQEESLHQEPIQEEKQMSKEEWCEEQKRKATSLPDNLDTFFLRKRKT